MQEDSIQPPETPENTLDQNDPGDEMQRRIRYQASYAAIKSLALLDKSSEVISILCEQWEDILVKRKDNKFIGIQVKTRFTGKEGFKAGDEEVLNSLKRFIQLENKFSTYFLRYVISANCSFWSEKKNGSSLVFLLEIAKKSSVDDTPHNNLLESFVRRLAKLTNTDRNLIINALRKVELEASPGLEDIDARLLNQLAVLPEMQEWRTEAVRHAAKRLVDTMQRAASLYRESLREEYLILLDDPDLERDNLVIEGKKITKEMVLNVLQPYDRESVFTSQLSTHLNEKSKNLEPTFEILSSTIGRLSSEVSNVKAQQIKEFQQLYYEGNLARARTCIETLRQDVNWDVFARSLKAQILRSLSGYVLSVEQDVERAKTLAEEARRIDLIGDDLVLQVLIRYYTQGATVALSLMDNSSRSSIDVFNLELGLLLELGRTDEVITKLQNLPPSLEPDAETNRIHALTLLEQGDVTGAQVKIQQAKYAKPTWEKIRASEATINYFSALSSAVPRQLMNFPLPVEWSFIKRDDESLQRLRSAVKEFELLASQTERGEQQRKNWQIWHLACLANDPERQVEAEKLCSILLSEDLTNPQAIIWRTVRNYDIDLSPSRQALEALMQEGTTDLERIIALLGIYLHLETPKLALDLLTRTRETFEQTKHPETWLFWYVQALALNGDVENALREAEVFNNSAVRRSIRVAILREQARANGDWQTLTEYLEACWQESRNGQYLLEACQLQASLQDWAYVADRADNLVTLIGTPDALSLAVQGTWQVGRAEQCLQLLNYHQHLFARRVLPSYLCRLKAYCQARLGLISQAVADAEELARLHETVETLVTLMDLQLNQGDLRGLASTASRLLRQETIQPIPLLRAARYLLSEDKNLARQLWQRAVTAEITTDVLNEVISLGYNLGLDRAVQPFSARARILAINGEEGPFQAVPVHELLKLQRKWTAHISEINQKYENVEIPVHLAAQANRFAIARIYRVLPKLNPCDSNPHLQAAVLVRYGARPFPEGFTHSSTQWRLHLDISAFLLAAHLGILDTVERRFHPIRISQTLPTALLQECEFFLQQQPSRLDNHREILRLHQVGQLRVLSQSFTPSSSELIEQLGEQSAILLEHARAENGFMVEFLPLQRSDTSGVTHPVHLEETDLQRTINCRGLVEVLKEEGILSSGSYETALNHLGDERYVELPAQLPARNDSIFVDAELARLMAGSDLLTRVCRYFRVFVTHQCIREAQVEISASEYSSEVVRWLRELIERVSAGLEHGKYEAIAVSNPESKQELELQQFWDAKGLTAYDLFRYIQPQPNDAIWIDDRFFSRYPSRDSTVPVIGVLEILEALRVNGDFSETEYYEKILQLRTGNIRYIPITSREITYYLEQAQVRNGIVRETEELTIIRRYIASCLLDSHRLQRPPLPKDLPSPDGEMMFVIECFRATQDSIANIWVNTTIAQETAIAYSDWILINLYTGMFGVRHLLPNVDLNNDGLDLISNDISSLYFRGIQLWRVEDGNFQNIASRRQQYFEWLERRITKNRFRANPELSSSVARLIKDIILYLGRERQEDESLQLVNRLMLKEFYRDLPSIIQRELDSDPELMTYLQVQTVESINLMLLDSSTPLIFPASDFFPAITAVTNGIEVNLTALQPKRTFRIRVAHQTDTCVQLHFIDESNSTTYAWEDDVILLASENPSVREQVLRSHRYWFDCDNCTFEKAVNEIVVTTDLRRRIDKTNEWREQSADVFYQTFEQKLHQNNSFSTDDLVPPSGTGLLRHFHLNQGTTEGLSFHEQLSQAAESLLSAEELETCLKRLSCLPVKLPTQITNVFGNLSSTAKEALLEKLASQLASPVCKLHLIDLALFSSNSINFTQRLLDEIFSRTGELQFRLFKVILNLLGNEFSYWRETREWSPSIRLAMIWGHASKLHNLLYNPNVNLEEFVQRLEKHTKLQAISADILDRNPSFWNDVLHPRRLDRMRLFVHGLAAILADHEPSILQAAGISEKVATFAVRTTEKQLFLEPALWHDDLTLAQDNLGSLLGGDRSEYLSSLLGADLGQQIASEQLHAIVEDAIEALTNEPLAKDKWLLIISLIGDLPIYNDLVEKFSDLVRSLNFVELYQVESLTTLFALMVATDHAANTADEELRSKLEEELVAISSLINTQEQTEWVDEEIGDRVLESAITLAVRANDPRTTSRSFNALLDRIFHAWSRFAGKRATGLSRVVQELPASELHGAWTSNLLMRALRDNE